MTDQPYNSLPVGVSPAVLEVIQQEGKEWERRAERLEKDWEYEKRRADEAEARAAAMAVVIVNLNAELSAREAEIERMR